MGLSGRRVEVDGQQDVATWVKACAALKGELGDALYGSYIAPARLRHGRGGRLVVVTPTGFAADWLRRNCWPRVREVWAKEDPAHRALELSSRQEFESLEGPDEAAAAASGAAALPARSRITSSGASGTSARMARMSARTAADTSGIRPSASAW